MSDPFLTINLADEAATLALGGKIGARVRRGDFVALHGALGAGKTTLARGIIQTFMGEDVDVPSPTFTLVQTYTRNGEVGSVADESLDLFHFDLYRLKTSDDVWELGWEDLGSGVAIVEWPNHSEDHLPQNRLEIHLSHQNHGRQAAFFARTSDPWKERLDGV
jgi:tRNA threonylcarbamoyladenosine biosynthesis protein TsaE